MPIVPFPALVGPTYQLQSLAADCERSVNLYPEAIESGQGKNRMYLALTPGLQVFAALQDAQGVPLSPVQGMFAINGRVFAVAGGQMVELGSDGTFTLRGAVGAGAVSMASNGSQILVLAGGAGFIYDLGANTVTPIASDGFPGGVACGYMDTYFLSLQPNSQYVSFSGPLDGTSWDGLDYFGDVGSGEKLNGFIISDLYVWLFGPTHAEIYYDSGQALTPFQRYGNIYLDIGLAAAASLVRLDNAIFWLASDDRGQGVVYRATGYQPQRISTHAIETMIAGFTQIADAYAWTYQENGHAFYLLTFPSATLDVMGVAHGATLVYDVATGLWHERGFWNAAAGQYDAHLGSCHAVGWGKNLVGDRQSGNVYWMKSGFCTDNGSPLRWLRRCPHLSDSQKWLFFSSLQLDMQVGVGLDAAMIPGSNPVVNLRYSNDGGNTWSNENPQSMGAIGQFLTRVIWRVLGRGRDRVWELSGSDPVPVALVNAYLGMTEGTN